MSLILPPSSDEAENAVLASLIVSPNSLDSVSDILDAGDFFRQCNRQIFSAVVSLRDDDRSIDVLTVAEKLKASGSDVDLLRVGEIGASYISGGSVRAYASIIKKYATQRRILEISQQIAEVAIQDGLKTHERIDQAQSLANSLSHQAASEGQQINTALRELLDVIDWRHKNPGQLAGLATGFEKLDERYFGLGNSNLIIIAARPSMGKTTLGMNIAENVFLKQDKPVLFFSMEMSRTELVARLIASQGGLDSTILRTGRLTEDDWPKLSKAVGKLKDKGLYIDDTPALHINQMRARARLKKRQHDIGMIVVDYIGLATSDAKGREERIGDVSRGLKALAKELDIPIIALAQLNRDCENRTDKRPLLSDLRDSGSLEQDADIVSFIYRDEVYNEDSPSKGVAEIITRKWRNGQTGTDHLASQLHLSRFENLSPNYQPAVAQVTRLKGYAS